MRPRRGPGVSSRRCGARGRSPRDGLRGDDLARAYAVLGVSAEANDEEIKRAYRRLLRQHHPDKLVAKGLRYGADTSGENRFLPPKPVTPWSGIRDALNYGNISPQMPTDRRRAAHGN